MGLGPLVSAEWLKDNLDDVVVLDASWHLPTAGRDAAAEFSAEHIPRARFFDIDAFSDQASDLPHMLPSADYFGEKAAALGVSNTDNIVVYDSVGLFSAARAWWMFQIMGHANVAVLDGGLPAWKEVGGPVEDGAASFSPAAFTATADLQRVADADAVLAASTTGDTAILDARGATRFAGEAPEPRPGVRSGHIPGAGSLPYDALLDGGKLKSIDELQAVFSKAGLKTDASVITTCGSGVTAAVLALGLTLIGRTDVRLYDGSWAEWGARTDLPLETGAA